MPEYASAKGKYKPSTTTELNQSRCLLHVSALVKGHHQDIKNTSRKIMTYSP
jgi:hypothetical protein